MTTTNEDAIIHQYKAWMRSNGAEIDALDWPVETPNTGRGAVALKDFSTGDPFLKLPASLLLSTPVAWRDAQVGEFLSSHRLFSESEMNTLVFFLAFQSVLGEKSFWAPYLAILPKNTGTLMSSWTTKELLELEDEELLIDVKVMIPNARRVVYDQMIDVMDKATMAKEFQQIFHKNNFTFDLYCWSLEIILSRSFGKRLPHISLVPLADNLNHNNVQTKYSFDGETFQIYPSGNYFVKQGEEAFNSYGRRANQNLLLYYGFSLQDNEWDDVTVELSLPPFTPNYEEKLEIVNGSAPVTLKRKKFCRDLLPFFRILVANPQELSNIKAEDYHSYIFVDFQSPQNERAAISACIEELKGILKGMGRPLREDLKLLKEMNDLGLGEVNMKIIFALRYRMGRKQPLQDTMNMLEKLQASLQMLVLNSSTQKEIVEKYRHLYHQYAL